ncbi:MAG: hypothetical protein NW220_03020 [Leptolyngbyaceae cyanobacterium bins.349]|nr:hypothetical protein [Leptolyngbyaceae cyanobacterium bins.349]
MAGSPHPSMLEPQPSLPEPFTAATWDMATLGKTVVQFRDRAQLTALTQMTSPPANALNAMQQLVDVISSLRSSAQEGSSPPSLTPATLHPYVSDEAYELLEALQQASASPPSHAAAIPSWTLLDALSPKLLWAVARSSYPTLQFVEGVPAKVCFPPTEWQSGILRLAVILQLETAGSRVELDLALGRSPQPDLEPHCRIQLEADHFAGVEYPPTLEEGLLLERSPEWLTQQLQETTDRLESVQPALHAWLTGVPVDLLLPNDVWQGGTLRLRLTFDFLPQPQGATQQAHLNPIDAELLEELEPTPSTRLEMGDRLLVQPTTPITVVEMPFPPAIATTMIRLAEPATLEKFIGYAMQLELIVSVNRLQAQGQQPGQQDVLLPLVQEAARLADLTTAIATTHFCLLQPELLLDELLPKLLWHLTRSSFTATEWLGGVPAIVYQPQTNWQSGTLRLVMGLNLQTHLERAQAEHWFIDLATGRFLTAEGWHLEAGAIAQLHPPTSTELVPIEQLQAQLQHNLAAAPELACLSQGVMVEWLTPAHDWQVGQLTLQAGLEFIPNLF